MSGDKPPEHIPPAQLWRMLIPLPRPTLPIAYRIRGAERVPLTVRALRSSEYAEAIEGDASTVPARLIAAALLTDGRPAFGSPDEVLYLDERELVDLAVHVRAALRIIGPTLITSDTASWARALEEGCAAGSNMYDALALGGCMNVSWGMGRKAVHVTQDPERWFGVPQRELLDCHWMAYFAACALRRKIDSQA